MIFLFRVQHARGERGHSITSESEYHGKHRLAVQTHHAEHSVQHHRRAAGTLNLPAHRKTKECGHNGKYQSQRVSDGHGEHTVFADDHFLQELDGYGEFHDARDRWVQYFSEETVLEQFHQSLRREHRQTRTSKSTAPQSGNRAVDAYSIVRISAPSGLDSAGDFGDFSRDFTGSLLSGFHSQQTHRPGKFYAD